MSVLLEYQSTQPVPVETAALVESDSRRFLKERCYWSEPLSVTPEHAPPARLAGGNAMFNAGGYESASGQWMDVSEGEDYLMAWSDTRFIVDALESWSRAHSIDWNVYSGGEPVGNVAGGQADERLLDFLEGLLEASELDPAMLAEIDRKFSNRCQSPETPSLAPSEAMANVKRTKKPWWRLW